MSKRMKVLFLAPPPGFEELGREEVIKTVGARHDLTIYDSKAPVARQFSGVDVVLDFGGIMGRREMADVASSVKLWQVLGTGIDHFDLEYWQQRNIPVANCPGKFTGEPLAEFALMLMIMLSRRWSTAQDNLRNRVLNLPLGRELGGRVLGLVGFGGSARELARRAKVFGMRILAIDIRDVSAEEQTEFGLEFIGKPDDLDRMIGQVDFLSLHLHLNDETRHIIDARRLSLLKPTAIFINVARGALVDEQALYQALKEGRLAGAGLDAFGTEPPDPDSPLLKLPNVVAAPHISGNTDGTWRRRAACAAENVDRLAAGLEPLYGIRSRQEASLFR
jgi:phosphoglycerate dehydrogenase-like enzyme